MLNLSIENEAMANLKSVNSAQSPNPRISTLHVPLAFQLPVLYSPKYGVNKPHLSPTRHVRIKHPSASQCHLIPVISIAGLCATTLNSTVYSSRNVDHQNRKVTLRLRLRLSLSLNPRETPQERCQPGPHGSNVKPPPTKSTSRPRPLCQAHSSLVPYMVRRRCGGKRI